MGLSWLSPGQLEPRNCSALSDAVGEPREAYEDSVGYFRVFLFDSVKILQGIMFPLDVRPSFSQGKSNIADSVVGAGQDAWHSCEL